MTVKTLTAAQCKAARGLVDMSQKTLAERAEVAEKTIVDFEKKARSPRSATLQALRFALESAGVEFIDENGGGPGVRLGKPDS